MKVKVWVAVGPGDIPLWSTLAPTMDQCEHKLISETGGPVSLKTLGHIGYFAKEVDLSEPGDALPIDYARRGFVAGYNHCLEDIRGSINIDRDPAAAWIVSKLRDELEHTQTEG